MDNFKIPIGKAIEMFINFLTDVLSPFTKLLSRVMGGMIEVMTDVLFFIPPIIFIIVVGVLISIITTKRNPVTHKRQPLQNYFKNRIMIFSVVGFSLIWNMGLWEPMISTIVLVLLATLVAMIIGLPLGIMGALSDRAYKVLRPILDFMQTLPAFVYLIPAIPFFGLGPVSAIFATVIFSIPPVIRLTSLGIRQIDKEHIEAADAFGSTTMQKLVKVQIPLALPTIMAGVNQTIMLSLSMVVIAAMIGAKGLGGEVWRAIQRLKMGMGFEAGIGIVIIAMILDRITQNLVAGEKKAK